MKQLPTGLQVFETIRKKDGLYVDKTRRGENQAFCDFFADAIVSQFPPPATL